MHSSRLSVLTSTLAVVIGVFAFAGVVPVSQAGTALAASETASGVPTAAPSISA